MEVSSARLINPAEAAKLLGLLGHTEQERHHETNLCALLSARTDTEQKLVTHRAVCVLLYRTTAELYCSGAKVKHVFKVNSNHFDFIIDESMQTDWNSACEFAALSERKHSQSSIRFLFFLIS